MRLLLMAGAIVALLSAFLSLAPGQQSNSGQKHVIIAPQNATRPVELEALSIERGLPYPSVVTLKGNARIKTPVCLVVEGMHFNGVSPVGRATVHVLDLNDARRMELRAELLKRAAST